MRKSGLSSDVGAFYECVKDISLYELMIELVDVVLNNPVDFGVLPNLQLGTKIADRSVLALKKYIIANEPYTNIGIFETPDDGNKRIHDIRLENMVRFISTFNLQQTIRDLSTRDIVALHLPFSFKIETAAIIDEPNQELIQIKYDPNRIDNNLRKCLTWRECTINVTDIDENALQRPDMYVKNFSNIDKVSIPRAQGRRIVLPMAEWLSMLDEEATPCVYIRAENVVIASIFARK